MSCIDNKSKTYRPKNNFYHVNSRHRIYANDISFIFFHRHIFE